MKKYKNREEYIEIYKSKYKSESYKYKNDKIEDIKIAEDIGVGVRVFKNGKKGAAYSNSIYTDIDGLIETALCNMEFSEEAAYEPKIDFIENDYKEKENDINKQDLNNIENILKENINTNITIPKSGISKIEHYVEIENNKGIKLNDFGQFFSFSVYAKAKKNDIMESGYAYISSRKKENLEIEKLVKQASQDALNMIGASSFNEQVPVLLDNKVAISFLGLISSSFFAKNYLENKSIFKGLENVEFYEKLNIIDDGIMKNGIATSLFDGEGVKREKTILMSNGKLNSFLHNVESSNKMNIKNTGNAYRSSLADVGISYTNLYIERGNKNFNSILKDTGKLFLVKEVMGLHMVNQITGDFALGASGFLCFNGEMKPVRGITINGNLKDIMKNIIEISDDLIFYGSTGSPKILIEGIKITGE